MGEEVGGRRWRGTRAWTPAEKNNLKMCKKGLSKDIRRGRSLSKHRGNGVKVHAEFENGGAELTDAVAGATENAVSKVLDKVRDNSQSGGSAGGIVIAAARFAGWSLGNFGNPI